MGGVLSLQLYGVGVRPRVPNYPGPDACTPGGRGCLEAPRPVIGSQAGFEVGTEAVTWSACCMLDTGTWRLHSLDNMAGRVEDAEDDSRDDDEDGGGDGDDGCDNSGNQTLHNTHYTLLIWVMALV